MKFSIGDKILLKRTGEEGHVIAVIDKKMVEVEVNGTAFPVHVDDVDHPYLKWFTQKKTIQKIKSFTELPPERVIERKPRLAKGAYLSYVPVFKTEQMEEVVDFIKVYLLNEMPVDIKFGYDVQLNQRSLFSHEGTLHAFGNVYLHNVAYGDMNDQPRFNWKMRDLGNDKMALAEGTVRIKPAKLFEHVNNVMLNSEPSFSYKLIDEFSAKKVTPPEQAFTAPLPQPDMIIGGKAAAMEAPKTELDLHIEQLVRNPKALSTDEIIKKQLDTLDKYLHLAIAHRQERMVVIHGLGEGKLREKVHAVLKRTPGVKRYKNEYSGKYGFGATEIWFRL